MNFLVVCVSVLVAAAATVSNAQETTTEAPSACNETADETTTEAPSACNETADGILFLKLRDGLESGKIVLIDVRNRAELEQKGAIALGKNIPLPELESAFRLSDSDFETQHGFPKPNADVIGDNLVISCRSGVRALHGWKMLNQFGFCEARVYYGSFLDWVANEGPLQKKET